MKSMIRRMTGMLLALFALTFAGAASAQTLYGVNPFSNDAGSPPGSLGLFYLNNTTGAITGGQIVTVPARTIMGVQGLAQDPTNGTVYAIARAAAVSGRLLITLNVTTGVGTEIGNLGDNFSSIAFRSDGQMFGVTGDGATVPRTLYLVNKANATSVAVQTFGAGADGEVIAYNSTDGFFYHWSRGAFERVQATAPYTITNIPIVTPAGSSEVFGAVWDPAQSRFLVHDIASIMRSWDTSGVVTNDQPATVADVRGMVLFVAPATVPTLSEWGMIIAALMLAGLGVVLVRRRFAA